MSVNDFLQEIGMKEYKIADTFEWVKQCNKWKQKYPNVVKSYAVEKPINTYYFTEILSDMVQENAVVLVDTGSVCNIVSQSWKLKEQQRYIISGGLSCMGFWAGAMGAVSKKHQTIVIAGDGSVQMNIQEFATLKYNHLPLKLFIYNNNGYMLIRHNQHNYMNDRFLGVGPDSGVQTPDFCAIAKAYGLPSIRISAEDDIKAKIQKVLEMDGPVICEVIAQEFMEIIPRISSKVMPDGSLKAADFDDLYPFLENK
jgi:acetolactate synthase-1/2/3 large subunit